MSINRYSFVSKVGIGSKTTIATNNISINIYRAANSGRLKTSKYILQEGERLDMLASKIYGDSSFWWVIAAASGIGWALQIPGGTLLRIPNNLGEALGLAS
tara:strand:- start:885 stop:1187 length:303 start_codon:yes stop_codon:yes gene_type:complete